MVSTDPPSGAGPFRITFLPGGDTTFVPAGTTIRDAALQLGIPIESTCGGWGTCGACAVQVTHGVAPATTAEEEAWGSGLLPSAHRLSCQASIIGDCRCTIPASSLPGAMPILTEGTSGSYPFEPDIRKTHLSLPTVPMDGPKERWHALFTTLHRLGCITHDPPQTILPAHQELLLLHADSLTVITEQGQFLDLELGDTTSSLLGVAVDIGTTTVAARLVDLVTGGVIGTAFGLNAQRPYGADVVSRIRYCNETPGGLSELQRSIVGQINALIGQMCREAGVPLHSVYRIVAAGNAVMQHLLLGVDPRSIAEAPYVPLLLEAVTCTAAGVGLRINPAAHVYVLPGLGSFVGGDITAALIILDPGKSDETHLIVDIGTNGEMVLGNRRRLVCCSSPAGPAWEGASISCGMPAAPGAIERAGIIDGDLVLQTIGNGPAVGVCGSGLLDIVAACLEAGLIDPTGRILGTEELPAPVTDALRARIVNDPTGAHHLRLVQHPDGRWLELRQEDVREVQLAKGAIATGIAVLMRELGLASGSLSRISVAGAFGNHLRAADAIAIGLLPDVPPDRIAFAGNAALAGAVAVLRSTTARERGEALARAIDYVEISAQPEFQDLFVGALHFPIRRP